MAMESILAKCNVEFPHVGLQDILGQRAALYHQVNWRLATVSNSTIPYRSVLPLSIH